jgi:hypothetical protein
VCGYQELLEPAAPRRQYAESWRRMQELRAQIQAQLRLADTIRRLGETAGGSRLDLDMEGNAEELKRLLEKAKKSRHGGGLEAFGDIDMERLEWVMRCFILLSRWNMHKYTFII